MADPQGLAAFGGIKQILSASLTLSHGISPSVCTVEIVPQDPFTLAPFGPLVLSYGSAQIVFPDCRIDRASYRLNAQGFVTSLQIQDRRWRWAYGSISGSYNILNAQIGINNDTRATLDLLQFRTA